MLSFARARLFCAASNSTAEAVSAIPTSGFTGRVGTGSNPRSLAPVVTSNVLNGDRAIDFTCISRQAAAKLVHAVAIANSKNVQDSAAFFKPTIASDLEVKDGKIAKGLTPFRLSVFPGSRPAALTLEKSRFTRRTKVSSNVDHEELAKNIHSCYLSKTPLMLECMGDKATGIITQAIALFNERVKAHDMVAFVSFASGRSAEGTEIVKIQFQLSEEPKDLH